MPAGHVSQSVWKQGLCGHLRCQLFTQKGEVRDIFSVCFAVLIGANSVCVGTSEVGYLHIVSTEGKVRDAYRVCFTVCVGTNCVGTSDVSYLHRRGG